MAVINVVFEEDELTNRVLNDFGLIYTHLRNQLYNDNNEPSRYYTAYLQMSSSIINVYKSLLELIPNVLIYKEKFDNGVLDPEHCEVTTLTSEHADYGKALLAAVCNRYKEALTALLISASEEIQTKPDFHVVVFTGDSYGYKHSESFDVCIEMLTEVRQFVRDMILADVSVLDYIINVAPILADTTVSELIWKRYIKHNVKCGRPIAVNSLVVGKLMVINKVARLAKLLDEAFEFVIKDTTLELDESSLLYYKVNPNIRNNIVFEHRLGPYAQALFAHETQEILSTPVIEGQLDKNLFKFGYRSRFMPVNAPTGETLRDAKCDGLLAKFAS